ncbi:unnamed protein product, partial [Allacma fusca]
MQLRKILCVFGILSFPKKVFTQPILSINNYETKIPNDDILRKIFTSLATCCHFNVILYPGYPVTEFSQNFLTKMGHIQNIEQVACRTARDRTPKRLLRKFVVNEFPKFQAFPAHIFIASTSPSYQVDPSDLTSLVKFKTDWAKLNVNPTNDFLFIFVEQRTNIFLEEARFNFTHLAKTLFHSLFPVNTIVIGISEISKPPVFMFQVKLVCETGPICFRYLNTSFIRPFMELQCRLKTSRLNFNLMHFFVPITLQNRHWRYPVDYDKIRRLAPKDFMFGKLRDGLLPYTRLLLEITDHHNLSLRIYNANYY